jgi:carboxyl-terminal processing protease
MMKSRLIPAGAFAAGFFTAALLAATSTGGGAAASNPDLGLIAGVMQLVQRVYVHPVGGDELTKDALKGMLTLLDPHSDYMDEQEFRRSQADLSGEFGGLGIQISDQGGIPKVISPIDGTPAARAGLQPGDLIVAIDGQSTHGMGLEKVVDVLRGKPGTSVKLTILRGSNASFDVSLIRSIIQVPTVKSKLEADNIGYVRISQFGGDTAKDFKNALQKLKQDAGGHLKGLVLDLRNDPGGLLSAAVEVSGDFLDGGTVVSIHGRQHSEDQSYNAPTNGDILPNEPIVVLINGASASASEIVAGALQDRHRATVMGTQSFGKGSVQTVIPLNKHGAVRLTTALYYTPGGRSIQGQGISPDVVVEAPKDEQVAGAVMLRESALRGAFTNPGPLGKTSSQPNEQSNQKPGAVGPASSPPIKADLIGTDKDDQLKAALDFLKRKGGTTGQVRSTPAAPASEAAPAPH